MWVIDGFIFENIVFKTGEEKYDRLIPSSMIEIDGHVVEAINYEGCDFAFDGRLIVEDIKRELEMDNILWKF